VKQILLISLLFSFSSFADVPHAFNAGDKITIDKMNENFNSLTQRVWHTPTLVNGWVNYDSGYQTVRYSKGHDGVVRIEGMVKSGTNNIVFYLPEDYRPKMYQIFTCYSHSGPTRVDVNPPDGAVYLNTGYSTNWTSISCVSYSVD